MTDELPFLQRALDQSYDGVLITDAELDPPGPRVVYANAAYERMTGYTADELKGRTPRILQGPETDRALLDALKAALKAGESYHAEAVNYRKDGTPYWVEWDISPVRGDDGAIHYYISIQRDVTRRKETERQLNETVREVERSNRNLQDFAYAASHDLQEPLRMVTNYLGLLERRYKDQLDDTAQEFMSFAVDGARRMQGMIQGLLQFSRVQTHGQPFEVVDANAVVSDVKKDLELAIEEAEGTVTVDDLPTVQGDPTQLRQVFQNLISNALKYHKEGEPPKVHVGVAADGAWWRFSVSDNGQGIPEAEQDRIFKMFQRLGPQGAGSGAGIGLSVAKRIVERHGGDLWLDSAEGEGATFHLTLPGADADGGDDGDQ